MRLGGGGWVCRRREGKRVNELERVATGTLMKPSAAFSGCVICLLSVLSTRCLPALPNYYHLSSVPIFGLDVIRHGFGFLVPVVMVMWVIRRPDVLHFVDAATLITTLVWSMPRHLILH